MKLDTKIPVTITTKMAGGAKFIQKVNLEVDYLEEDRKISMISSDPDISITLNDVSLDNVFDLMSEMEDKFGLDFGPD